MKSHERRLSCSHSPIKSNKLTYLQKLRKCSLLKKCMHFYNKISAMKLQQNPLLFGNKKKTMTDMPNFAQNPQLRWHYGSELVWEARGADASSVALNPGPSTTGAKYVSGEVCSHKQDLCRFAVILWFDNFAVRKPGMTSTSHSTPCQSTGHVHVNKFTRLLHVPPFWHGVLAHSFTSEIQIAIFYMTVKWRTKTTMSRNCTIS